MSAGAQPLHPPLPEATAQGDGIGTTVHKPRNIVICCDGTGNEFGDTNSNVVKLYTALEIDAAQVAYYHPGVGTMGDPNQQHRLGREWSRIKGLVFSAGFKTNVLDAYQYLMETYNDGDRLYLIGFSRGAYTVRALAGLLDGYGLLCRGNEGHLPYAWRLYVNQHDVRTRNAINPAVNSAAAFKETFSHKDFRIHFVGVWDTVSSVGWIYTPLRLFNVAQNKTIATARQALSIDERRCFYQDNLWGDSLPGQDVEQVWFAGVHSDVGGSYPQESSGLSNIPLQWMLVQAHNAGIRLIPERVKLVLGEPTTAYPACQPLYEKPKSSPIHKSLKGLWWALEALPHIFYDKDLGEELHRIPFGAWRKIPDGALVHSSVVQRLKDHGSEYSPKNLAATDLTEWTSGPKDPAGKPILYVYGAPTPALEERAWMRPLVLWSVGIVEVLLGLTIVFFAVRGCAWAIAHMGRALCRLWSC
jgi:hypothetical protein